MWIAAGDGEEVDEAAHCDGPQRCITADTKWSQVQVLPLVVQLACKFSVMSAHVLGVDVYKNIRSAVAWLCCQKVSSKPACSPANIYYVGDVTGYTR